MKRNLRFFVLFFLMATIAATFLTACKPVEVKYQVYFIANDEIVSVTESKGNEEIALPTAPNVTDFEFVGWYLDPDSWKEPFDGKNFADKPLTADVKVYAKYDKIQTPEPEKYTISFIADGKTVSETESAGNEEIALPTAPNVTDFEFVGWYLDPDSWEEPFDGKNFADKPLTADVKVYAKYDKIQAPEPEKYTISFIADGKTVSKTESAGNEEIALPTAPNVTGFEFVGWYLDPDSWEEPFDGKNFADKPLTADVKVYAKYDKIQTPVYCVEFDTDGGTPVEAMTVSVIESAPYTEKNGFTFAGWFEDASRSEKAEFPYYPEGDTTLYALWTRNAVQFTLDSDGKISGITGSPEDGVLIIPATVNGIKVKGIAAYAFRGNTDITEVRAAEEITNFGVGCFWNCKNLVSVTISDSVTSIPSDMFNGCSSLNRMNFPSALKTIEYDAFWGTAFTEIVLPDTVTEIWDFAFKDCVHLRSIDLGGVVSLGDSVFMNCTQLTSVVIPDTVRDLSGNYMFGGCTNLTDITFPSVPVTVEYSFLDGTGYFNEPSNWEDGALYLNRHLITVDESFAAKQSFTVKEGTICIANHAFAGSGMRPAVKKITLPDGVLAIGAGAFGACSALTETNIPDSVRFVGKDAYFGTAFYQIGKTNYLDHWLLSYDSQSSQTRIVIQDGTIGIAEGRLISSWASDVTEVVLPESLKVIGESNFESMTTMASLNLPQGLERIGKNAFRYCYALSGLDLSACRSLYSIGDYAFSFCKAMTRFHIPSSVQELGEGVFNQIPGVAVDFEIGQSEIPAGWSKAWNFTYADTPVIANWGVKNS